MEGIQIALACGTVGVGLYTALQGRLFAANERRVDKLERHDEESVTRVHDLEVANAELTQRCNALTSHGDELERRIDGLEQTTARKREFERMQGRMTGQLVNINRAIWKIAHGKELSDMPGAPNASPGDFES